LYDFGLIVFESLVLPFSYFFSPEKRLFIGYLLTSICMAYWVYRREAHVGFFQYLLPREHWLGQSARVDIQLVFVNAAVKVALLGQLFIYGLHLAFFVTDILLLKWGPMDTPLSSFGAIWLFAVASTVLGDCTVYWVHVAFHRIPWLWDIHKVHHSATTLNPVTQLRIHPIELVVHNVRATMVFGILAGLMDYLSGGKAPPMTLVGVNFFGVLFFAWGANLRHSHIRLSYWHFLEYVLISPTQHQIHHSRDPKHHNRNYGSKLALWDWMFGTLCTSRNETKITVGLDEESQEYRTTTRALLRPFRSWI